MVRRQVVVTGRVQGVWFRETCKEQAEALGVTGWVRNRDDGRVEAAFEGEPDAVDQMVAWCRSGSSLASVDDIEVTEQDPVGDRGFTTR
jgi:acylphosphatase